MENTSVLTYPVLSHFQTYPTSNFYLFYSLLLDRTDKKIHPPTHSSIHPSIIHPPKLNYSFTTYSSSKAKSIVCTWIP